MVDVYFTQSVDYVVTRYSLSEVLTQLIVSQRQQTLWNVARVMYTCVWKHAFWAWICCMKLYCCVYRVHTCNKMPKISRNSVMFAIPDPSTCSICGTPKRLRRWRHRQDIWYLYNCITGPSHYTQLVLLTSLGARVTDITIHCCWRHCTRVAVTVDIIQHVLLKSLVRPTWRHCTRGNADVTVYAWLCLCRTRSGWRRRARGSITRCSASRSWSTAAGVTCCTVRRRSCWRPSWSSRSSSSRSSPTTTGAGVRVRVRVRGRVCTYGVAGV